MELFSPRLGVSAVNSSHDAMKFSLTRHDLWFAAPCWVAIIICLLVIGGCIPAHAQSAGKAGARLPMPPAPKPVSIVEQPNGARLFVCRSKTPAELQVTNRALGGWTDVKQIKQGAQAIRCEGNFGIGRFLQQPESDYRLVPLPFVESIPQPITGLPDIRKNGMDGYGTVIEKPKGNKTGK
jgi:hypothetical protein